MLLSLGASVVSADLQPPPASVYPHKHEASGAFAFVRTDVVAWAELVALFDRTRQLHGRVDHVFANAGIGPLADFLSTAVDGGGMLREPVYDAMAVGLKGVMNTATLGVYHIRQHGGGGSIVITGSAAGLQPLRAVDYGESSLPSSGDCTLDAIPFLFFFPRLPASNMSVRQPPPNTPYWVSAEAWPDSSARRTFPSGSTS